MAFGAGLYDPGQALDTGASPTLVGATLTGLGLTAGTMTANSTGVIRCGWSSYSWTNAMVVALGASLTGDVTICTLPAKVIVRRALVVINSAAAGVATLTVAVGRTSAGYIDYVVASDAKAAANTVYGDATDEIGSHLYNGTGFIDDLASWTGTTAVKAHFISTVQTLDATTTSTGTVYLETVTLL